MLDDADYSIEQITQLAIAEVSEAISGKIGRDLTDDESGAIAAIIGTEHFWARAEEFRMFVQHKDASHVLAMVTSLGSRYRDFKAGISDFAPAKPDPVPRARYCNMCNGSGECYCIRKGPGTAAGCPRCAGNGICRHCRGSSSV